MTMPTDYRPTSGAYAGWCTRGLCHSSGTPRERGGFVTGSFGGGERNYGANLDTTFDVSPDEWRADDVYLAPPPFVRPDLPMPHQVPRPGYSPGYSAPIGYAPISPPYRGPADAAPSAARRSRLSRKAKVISFSCAALALIVLALGLVANSKRTHDLTLPATFSSYTRLTNGTAKQIEQQARARLRAAGATTADALVFGVYARTGSDEPTVFFDGFGASDSDRVATQLRTTDPKDVVAQALAGTGVTGTAAYPTGPFGGAVRCGMVADGGDELPVCAWADTKSTAVMVFEDGSDENGAATALLAMRAAAEH